MTKFQSISLYNWRQFAAVHIDFDPRLTIITGSNGAGKSTVLNICSQHFGFMRPFISTPKIKRGGGIEYDLGYYNSQHTPRWEEEIESQSNDFDDDFDQYVPKIHNEAIARRDPPRTGEFVEIGDLTYDNGVKAKLGYAENQAQAFNLSIMNQQSLAGVPISSHRTMANYQQVGGLSLQLVSIPNAYQAFFQEYIQRQMGGHTAFSPLYRMKETIIAMAAFGQGNQYLEKNPELYAAFEGFTAVLKKVLPKEIGFQRILVRVPDVVLKTKSGEFTIDSSSGGVTAIIEIAWQLYLYSLTNMSFVVTLDEPENHLHPAMQRTILSNLLEAFPGAQFIVATHSPFIVSAVENSRVFALKYTGSVGESGLPRSGPRRVRSIALDQAKKSGDASETLKEVLGVNVSIPEWAEKKLESIVTSFEGKEISSDTLRSLRAKLFESGFSEYYPEALAQLVKGQ